MRLKDDDIKKIERVLAEAHHTRQAPSLGAGWTRHVMEEILHRPVSVENRQCLDEGTDQFIWRFAAIACLCALIFTGSIVMYGNASTTEIAGSLSEDLDTGASLIE
jgi:hypothetical protein